MTTRDNENAPAEGPDPSTRAHKQAGRPGAIVADATGLEVERIVAKLRDPDAVFTTSEVAYLMSRAGRWGYEHRVDEENETWPPPRVYVFGRWYDQAAERQKADAEVRRLAAQERGR
jgi:hypothetical protein